jgi:hypothetical protein
MSWHDEKTEEWHEEPQPTDQLDRIFASEHIIGDLESHHLIDSETGMIHTSIILLLDGKIVMTPSADIHYYDLQTRLIEEFSADDLQEIGIAGVTVEHTEISRMGTLCCQIDFWLESADGLFTIQGNALRAFCDFSIISHGQVLASFKKGTPKLRITEYLYQQKFFPSVQTDIIRDITEDCLVLEEYSGV